MELSGLFKKEREIVRSSAQANNAEEVRVLGDEFEGLHTDRTG
jgi:hypothetical protein